MQERLPQQLETEEKEITHAVIEEQKSTVEPEQVAGESKPKRGRKTASTEKKATVRKPRTKKEEQENRPSE